MGKEACIERQKGSLDFQITCVFLPCVCWGAERGVHMLRLCSLKEVCSVCKPLKMPV